MTRRFTRAASLAAAAFALAAGCSADRVAGIRPQSIQPAPRMGADPVGCKFTVQSIDDLREHKNLGEVARTSVDGEGFTAWFANGFKDIPGHTAGAAPIRLRVEVVKAYIQSLATLKSANLVVRVTTEVEGSSPRTKMYRGVDGSVNWSSSESEIQLAFENALTDLRRQIGADLAGMCRH